ncbi:MAG TPA: glycosyltransferase [Candidatus Nanoarchaeia archaeon]|nr:glycosyltransferase [Candidatus Nanoarchaeia archaeon]
MKILVLTSRYTATRDIIGEDFGRQTRLFSAFLKLGNEVDFYVADYRKFEKKDLKLHGINVSIRAFGIFSFFSFYSELKKKIKSEKYDFVIGSGDPLWGVAGYILVKNTKSKFVYDLHDNYETYSSYRLPFFGFFEKIVLKNSDFVTTVSNSLKNKIKKKRKNAFVIQNGVDLDLFKPINMMHCRESLKLPKKAKIVGYAGSIQRLQGVDILIEAVKQLREKDNNIFLAIAGRFYKDESRHFNLVQGGIIYLGTLSQDKVVKLVNACDVVVVPNPSNEFTKYCFPYKVIEYMACNRPIVATDVGDVSEVLKGFKNSLCKENDIEDIKKKIKIQLNAKKINYRKKIMNNSWDKIAMQLEKVLKGKIK